MNIRLLVIGKTQSSTLDQLVEDYAKRLNHYCKFRLEYGEPKIKKAKLDISQIKAEESKYILEQIPSSSYLILLDEAGKDFSSTQFAAYLQKRLNAGPKEIVFCIGGAYGFSPELYERADAKVALSKMTLTHQMVRLLAIEQLYRAFTILRGEKYHH